MKVFVMKKNKKSGHSKISIFTVIGIGTKIIIKSFPIFFLILLITSFLHGMFNGFSIFVTQQFYDTISDILQNNEPISHAYLIIIILGSTFIMREALHGVYNFMESTLVEKTNGEMAKIIHAKIARIDPICFENKQFHEDIAKATTGAAGIVRLVNLCISIFTFYIPYFIFMGFYLQYLKMQFVFAIVLVFVPVLLSQFIHTAIIKKFEDEATPIKRKYDYYRKTITDKEYFKETRILGAFRFFIERFKGERDKLDKTEWKMSKQTNLLELIMALLNAAGYAGVLFMLVAALLAGDITIGAFAAVFSSIGKLFDAMKALVSGKIGDMAPTMGRGYYFVRFMEIPERSGIDSIPEFDKGIIADNVSFIYPNAENKSIDNVSLTIKHGEKLAIVGRNGAGKTTLVRLLIGLYTPTEGCVTINGMDTSLVNQKSIFQGLSGIFQKFQRYRMTFRENVQISDSNSNASIENVAEQAGVDINSSSFPDGAETMLSREFEGVDLSGGEWQRIAIARGLYRFYNVIVLDEPTAAIDPIEESRIYKKFIEISKNKTAIIITHRLGSTKIADRVIVMDNGKIADTGSHYELMQKQGLYSEMFNSQASWYEEVPEYE